MTVQHCVSPSEVCCLRTSASEHPPGALLLLGRSAVVDIVILRTVWNPIPGESSGRSRGTIDPTRGPPGRALSLLASILFMQLWWTNTCPFHLPIPRQGQRAKGGPDASHQAAGQRRRVMSRRLRPCTDQSGQKAPLTSTSSPSSPFLPTPTPATLLGLILSPRLK